MKKKLLITTGILLTLVPSLIRADNVFPSTLSYKAVITNKNGFKCDTYDNKNITIPFGSIVSVRESYYDSNLELEIVDYADTRCNNKISLNDIKIYNDEFNSNDYLNAGESDSVSKFVKVNTMRGTCQNKLTSSSHYNLLSVNNVSRIRIYQLLRLPGWKRLRLRSYQPLGCYRHR